MLIAHKIALDPNNAQATYFTRTCGVARFAYNWALAEWKRQYEAWKQDNSLPKPSQAALRRQLNAIKRDQFPWMLEVTKCAPQMAIIQLGQAFQNFFAGRARYPQPRKKGVDDRFTLINDQFTVEGCRIRIPNLGWVRMHEPLRFAGKLMSATISRVADRWFSSSKMCSACGHKQEELPLSVREWTCPECGSIHDRDVNAAKNLLAYGLAALSGPTASSAGCQACGEEGSGSGRKTRVKPASAKQEISFVPA
jgi:transposase